MRDSDLIAMLERMAYQIEGEAREVRANTEADGPDWATATLSRHVENLDCDATVLRAAAERIARAGEVEGLKKRCDELTARLWGALALVPPETDFGELRDERDKMLAALSAPAPGEKRDAAPNLPNSGEPLLPAPGVREAMMEECAKIADQHATWGAYEVAASAIAAAIRARLAALPSSEDSTNGNV